MADPKKPTDYQATGPVVPWHQMTAAIPRGLAAALDWLSGKPQDSTPPPVAVQPRLPKTPAEWVAAHPAQKKPATSPYNTPTQETERYFQQSPLLQAAQDYFWSKPGTVGNEIIRWPAGISSSVADIGRSIAGLPRTAVRGLENAFTAETDGAPPISEQPSTVTVPSTPAPLAQYSNEVAPPQAPPASLALPTSGGGTGIQPSTGTMSWNWGNKGPNTPEQALQILKNLQGNSAYYNPFAPRS